MGSPILDALVVVAFVGTCILIAWDVRRKVREGRGE